MTPSSEVGLLILSGLGASVHQRWVVTARSMGSEFVPGSGSLSGITFQGAAGNPDTSVNASNTAPSPYSTSSTVCTAA